MSLYIQRTLVFLAVISSSVFALKGTRGTPIGGMGTGYVKYNALTGNFCASGKVPPAASSGWDGADYTTRKIASSGFYFFAGGEAVERAKTTDEDARCPVYLANFAALKGITFKLTAFGPYNPGDNPENFKLATSPLAFFDIEATNGSADAVDIAAAMEFANGGLLGGAASGTVDGTQAISFSGEKDNAYLAVDCDASSPVYSSGAVGTFTTNGTLANTDGNMVAAKCSIAPGATVHFKFTLSWWRHFETTSTSYYPGWDGKENYWYHNNFSDSKKVSAFGREKFDLVKTGITSFVNRTMASNFPDWYKDRLLNNTYPLIHNSQVTQDGRLAFWEGLYGIIGTIDQGQHAALFYTFNWPEVQWKELNYWRSTARNDFPGQIHHDFNKGISNFHSHADKDRARFVCPLKGSNNMNDYWWFKVNGVQNTNTWADLNVMFIFKAYELMLATGNRDSITSYLPDIKRTAQRILTQCGEGSKLPLNCHSTYDESNDGGNTFNTCPEYNGSIVLPCYLAVSEIAKFCGDTATATQYRGYYETARTEFKTKFANAPKFATGKDYSEGDVAGYSWANYFCFEPVMDSDFVTDANRKLWAYYPTRTEESGADVEPLRRKLGKWGFYTCDHWGGVNTALGKADSAMIIHGWDHEYYYKNAPDMVFWQTLRKDKGSNKSQYASYMTGPTVWRSYFQMLGYLIDNANQRLWIRPRLLSSMNQKIEKGLLLNPSALGTLNYDETKEGERTQLINVSYDKPVAIKEFVVKNNTGKKDPGVRITHNGATVSDITVKTEGSAYEKNIRITLGSPVQIGPDGVKIEVFETAVGIHDLRAIVPAYSLSLHTSHLRSGSTLRFSVDKSGPVSIELLNLNGSKIGTILHREMVAGSHSVIWNGKTIHENTVSSKMYIIRLKTRGGILTKAINVLKQ
ncbi:MAG: hypothetical protein JW915_03710 [Chitinispirillaceae bacterium]|nr:hypothetical protein [Chitinispirillaceae bacterium]